MQVVVPFDVEDPKTRLAPLMTPGERSAFARAMLTDVLDAIEATGREPTVCATAGMDIDRRLSVDDRSLSDAINAIIDASTEPVAIVMADLALVTPTTLDDLFSADGDVVLAPGRGGGTNAVVVRHPDFYVDYHGTSVQDHRRIAREADLSRTEIDSFRLAIDIDDPTDLIDVLCHGMGEARDTLLSFGFDIATVDDSVELTRRESISSR